MKWIDRKFVFDFPASIYPDLIQRLQTTPQRLETLVDEIPPEIMTVKPSQTWSIQENVGHLLTVDSLFNGRLDDYAAGAAELRPAKVDGSRTDQADYNSWQMSTILTDFRDARVAYIGRLYRFETDFFERESWHPRLQQPMRVCDMLYFQAEHDDYHLEKIKNLNLLLTTSAS